MSTKENPNGSTEGASGTVNLRGRGADLSAVAIASDAQWCGVAFEFEVGDIVEVCWIDSASSHAWSNRANEINNPDRRKSMLVRSVGYVVQDDNDVLMLVESRTAHDSIGCSTTIPKFAIQCRRALGRAG